MHALLLKSLRRIFFSQVIYDHNRPSHVVTVRAAGQGFAAGN